MSRGRLPSYVVDAPDAPFPQLALQELDLHAVKRRYIRAVYFWTKSVTRTAKICKVARNTVEAYLT